MKTISSTIKPHDKGNTHITSQWHLFSKGGRVTFLLSGVWEGGEQRVGRKWSSPDYLGLS